MNNEEIPQKTEVKYLPTCSTGQNSKVQQTHQRDSQEGQDGEEYTIPTDREKIKDEAHNKSEGIQANNKATDDICSLGLEEHSEDKQEDAANNA